MKVMHILTAAAVTSLSLLPQLAHAALDGDQEELQVASNFPQYDGYVPAAGDNLSLDDIKKMPLASVQKQVIELVSIDDLSMEQLAALPVAAGGAEVTQPVRFDQGLGIDVGSLVPTVERVSLVQDVVITVSPFNPGGVGPIVPPPVIPPGGWGPPGGGITPSTPSGSEVSVAGPES